jgi:hypothetical protein
LKKLALAWERLVAHEELATISLSVNLSKPYGLEVLWRESLGVSFLLTNS